MYQNTEVKPSPALALQKKELKRLEKGDWRDFKICTLVGQSPLNAEGRVRAGS
jgi:hypothetical protein